MYALSLPATEITYAKKIGFGTTLCCRKPVEDAAKMQREEFERN